MKKHLLMIASLFLFISFLFSDNSLINPPNNNNDSLSLVFSGDIMGHSFQFKAAHNPSSKNTT